MNETKTLNTLEKLNNKRAIKTTQAKLILEDAIGDMTMDYEALHLRMDAIQERLAMVMEHLDYIECMNRAETQLLEKQQIYLRR